MMNAPAAKTNEQLAQELEAKLPAARANENVLRCIVRKLLIENFNRNRMTWHELMLNFPSAALIIRDHLNDCGPLDPSFDPEHAAACDPGNMVFVERNGVIRGTNDTDKIRGVPPIWYFPEGYVTGDPTKDESERINAAGFRYDWKDWIDE